MKHLLLIYSIALLVIAAALIIAEPSSWKNNVHLLLIGGIALEFSLNNKSQN